jgi:hypothetical protein
MRYRRLTQDELEGVEAEFIRYLASEGISADDWKSKLVSKSPDVEACLDAFSELFWDGATQAIQSIEHRPSEADLYVFNFGERSADVIHCKRDNGMAHWSKGAKVFEPEARGREIFLLLEQGATPCEKDRFNAVQKEMVSGLN